MATKELTPATARAVGRYGVGKCLKAFELSSKDGEGPSTIGIYLGLKTQQADKAIDAGRELAQVRANTLDGIAWTHFGMPTLERRNSDSLDFRDVAVWSVKAALEEAFELGRKSAGGDL